MKFGSSFVAWIVLAAAVAAWCGVAFFALSIQNMTDSVVSAQGDAQNASDRQVAALQLHSLAQQVAPTTMNLETMLRTDPITLAGLIKQAGTDAGVVLQVSDASSEGATGAGAQQSATALGFTVHADGSFGALVHAAALLESLPVPAHIETLDIGKVSGAGGWHLDAHVRVLTSVPVSS